MDIRITAALITAAAVVLGLVVQSIIATRTLSQKRRSDDRAAHWDRIEWAIDKTMSAELQPQEVGAQALELLVADRSLNDRDKLVVLFALDTLDDKQAQAQADAEADAAGVATEVARRGD